MPDIKEKIVPGQKDGGKKDIEQKITAVDIDQARKIFSMARNRLFNVNRWHEIAEGISAKFHLTDENGTEVDRPAKKGDLFMINLPAPGPAEGQGTDWVVIESFEDKSDARADEESVAFRVRPTQNPRSRGENVAHFFNEEATSTFVVERKGKEILAAVYGRNEKPNTETHNLIDKIRNAVVGTSAIAGLSNIQWGNLVKGLIAVQKS